MFRLHNSLGPQVAPTARPRRVLGGRAIYTRPDSGSLPAQSTGIATCLKRATGTAGLAPAGLRPCRLLLSPFPFLTVYAAQAFKKGKLEPGDRQLRAGRLGVLQIQGDNILLGRPFVFNKSNIDQFDF
jgi:hypothetical protein